MIKLDDKQRRLIVAWYERAGTMHTDTYGEFISLWIAFNAFCCAKYGEAANRLRADLQVYTGLKALDVHPVKAEATLSYQDNRYTLKIDDPGRIVIRVSERYTEDLVFQQFVKEFSESYAELCKPQSELFALVSALQSALTRDEHCYVINMAKAENFDKASDFLLMARANIIVMFDDATSLLQLEECLYQIRCNIFHGEKKPGEVNDDRILESATPVLRMLLSHVLSADEIRI